MCRSDRTSMAVVFNAATSQTVSHEYFTRTLSHLSLRRKLWIRGQQQGAHIHQHNPCSNIAFRFMRWGM